MKKKINETLYIIALVFTVLCIVGTFVFGLVLQDGIAATIFMCLFVTLSCGACIFTKDGNKFSI